MMSFSVPTIGLIILTIISDKASLSLGSCIISFLIISPVYSYILCCKCCAVLFDKLFLLLIPLLSCFLSIPYIVDMLYISFLLSNYNLFVLFVNFYQIVKSIFFISPSYLLPCFGFFSNKIFEINLF